MDTLSIITIVAAAFIALGYGAWYVLAAPTSQAICPAISSGSSNANTVALTFDDGPGPETLPILEVLRQHRIHATFFLCGANVERYPELARKIAEQGHCIGNHAYSHRRLLWRSPGWIHLEIARASSVISAHLDPLASPGKEFPSGLFRPPYGLRWFGLSAILKLLDLQAVMWNVNSEDWKRSPEQIVDRVSRLAKAGSIILLHDGLPPLEKGTRKNTVAALPGIIQNLSARFQLVTIPQLIEQERNRH